MTEKLFQRILVPVDHSRESGYALTLVAQLALAHSSELVLLSVATPDTEEPEAIEIARQRSRELLDQALQALDQQGLSAATQLGEGQVAFVICDVADELAVDLIVMGCRGLGVTEAGQDDSVANRVINLAPCPVLVVP